MQQTCIVTDTAAQFPKHKSGWEEFVRILPIHFEINKTNSTSSDHPSPNKAYASPSEWIAQSSNQPDQIALRSFLSNLAHEFREVLFLLPTKTLFPSFTIVTQALQQMNLSTIFTVIDSRSLGYGLGWLIQACIDVLSQSDNLIAVRRFLHHKIPQIYTLVYLHDLTSLGHSQVLDPDQAFIGEFLGIRPLILLEHDQIMPYQKTRNFKHLVDSMFEYAHEFDQIEYLGLHFGTSISLSDRKSIQNRLQSILSQYPCDAQVMNPYLSQILGDQAVCMILIESDKKHEF
ncbi:MAG: DegV family protein [Anaerolineales bacterium]|nr:DegV family protein [Anaerolineales bacterium]